jgi:hypothetical protein
MGDRYVAVEGSTMGHGCCFDGTVIDTEAPEYDNVLCECCTLEQAKMIAAALNERT